MSNAKTPSLHLVKEEHRDDPSVWLVANIYKSDKRRRAGRRLVETRFLTTLDAAIFGLNVPVGVTNVNSLLELHRAYVVRHNLMTQEPFWEPYGTPNCVSPASETYWSM